MVIWQILTLSPSQIPSEKSVGTILSALPSGKLGIEVNIWTPIALLAEAGKPGILAHPRLQSDLRSSSSLTE